MSKKGSVLITILVAGLLAACSGPTPAAAVNNAVPSTGRVRATQTPAAPAADLPTATGVPALAPTATSTPTLPTPTPLVAQAVSFGVTQVFTSAALDTFSYSDATHACAATYIYQADVFASGAGQVTYYWLRSDGSRTPDTTLNFNNSNLKKISDVWTISSGSASVAGTDRLILVQPIQQAYPAVGVNFYCAPLPPAQPPKRPGGRPVPTAVPTKKP